ncbi:MAG: hypothetical protein OXF98_06760, partial [Rhodospirillaceae bacterium]|nr:hypothetical protein [Rhodospirillaceae bacterium]
MDEVRLLNLARIYADRRSLTLTTVSCYATSSGATFRRLTSGHTLTSRRAARIVQWFSDHWPADVDWPAEIERPAPAADSPVALAEAELLEGAAVDPVAAVAREIELMDREMRREPVNWAAFGAAEERKFKAATVLRGGRILNPAALCLALGESRSTYDYVCKHYANSTRRPGRYKPRDGTNAARMLALLVVQGRARVAHPRHLRDEPA